MNTTPTAAFNTAPTVGFRHYGREYRSHRHDFHQLVLPLSGTLEMHTGSGARRVDMTTGVVVPAGEKHGFAARGANRFVVVDVPGFRDSRCSNAHCGSRPYA